MIIPIQKVIEKPHKVDIGVLQTALPLNTCIFFVACNSNLQLF